MESVPEFFVSRGHTNHESQFLMKFQASFNKTKILDELLGLGSEPLPNVFMAVPTIYVNLIDEIQNRNLDKVRVFSRFCRPVIQNSLDG